MNNSCLYLAKLRSIQNRCNFATICARKGYTRKRPHTDRVWASRQSEPQNFPNFYKADTHCDILLLSVRKYRVGGLCLAILCKQKERLNSWILRLGKAGLE